MILQPTVLVLGAAASQPYGFPLGRDLASQAIGLLSNRDQRTDLVLECAGARQQEADDLVRFFRPAGRESLDAFLESQPQYLDLAKAAMAAVLLPLERDDALDPDPNTDWVRYLMNWMMEGQAHEDFKKNQLSVITFNFDRSFQRKVFRTLQNAYPIDVNAAAGLAATIEVVHANGSLGFPGWLEDKIGGRYKRDYQPIANANQIQEAAKSIRIAPEGPNTGALERAFELLADAQEVNFLGFSYHPLNLAKLRADEWPRTGTKTIRGTVFGLPEGERQPIWSIWRKGSVFTEYDGTILDMLRTTDTIHRSLSSRRTFWI